MQIDYYGAGAKFVQSDGSNHKARGSKSLGEARWRPADTMRATMAHHADHISFQITDEATEQTFVPSPIAISGVALRRRKRQPFEQPKWRISACREERVCTCLARSAAAR
ncbi:MAG: hypothetical protein WBO95_03695 [Candidatus Dechloromonas phosphoritropha]|nr:hypothetical protein [Azonexus sp.]